MVKLIPRAVSRVRNVVVWCFLAAGLVVAGNVSAADAVLEFRVSKELVRTLTLAELRNAVSVQEIDMHDPMHGKRKRYQAFALGELLRYAFGDALESEHYSEVVFAALDGYQSVSTRTRVLEAGGFVAFRDLDRIEGWEPVGRQNADPAPFYLVWTGEAQSTQNGYPWPWQLRSVALLRFEEQFPKVFPQGAGRGTAAYQGYLLFKERCVRCHTMDGQGGKIGPDLNAPHSILEYRSAGMVRDFIRSPSKFRHTKMPDHRDLTETDLDKLLDYFWFMRPRR